MFRLVVQQFHEWREYRADNGVIAIVEELDAHGIYSGDPGPGKQQFILPPQDLYQGHLIPGNAEHDVIVVEAQLFPGSIVEIPDIRIVPE
jgi:hypothetical protein